LRALEPIANNGGNLLSIFHERGSLTPRGHIPVEVDLECAPHRFEQIVAALRDAGVAVIAADAERYGEAITVLLVGDLVDTDLSDTLSRLEACSSASVADLSLTDEEGRRNLERATPPRRPVGERGADPGDGAEHRHGEGPLGRRTARG